MYVYKLNLLQPYMLILLCKFPAFSTFILQANSYYHHRANRPNTRSMFYQGQYYLKD